MDKNIYFVFGQEICDLLDEYTAFDIINDENEEFQGVSFELFHWNNDTSCPTELLNAYSGYDAFFVITKEEYNLLLKRQQEGV